MAGGKELLKGAVKLGAEVADDIMGLVLYSPSLKAARKLPQAKGTYQQLRQMLLKGGAKEDELVWSGFDRAFRDRKGTISKDEIEAYLAQNTDLIDEVSDTAPGVLSEASSIDESDLVDRYIDGNLESEVDYYRNDWLPERLRDEYRQVSDLSEDELNDLADSLGVDRGFLDDKGDLWVIDDDIYTEEDAIDQAYGDIEEMARESLYENARSMDINELRSYVFGDEADDIADPGDTQYSNYFTKGARDYTEKRYVLNPDTPVNESRARRGIGGHWNEDNVVAHARTGEFPVAGGGRAYHVGEVQSDWGQKLRGQDNVATPDQEMDLSGLPDAKLRAEDAYRAIQMDLTAPPEGINPGDVDTIMRRFNRQAAQPGVRTSRITGGMPEYPPVPQPGYGVAPVRFSEYLRDVQPPEGGLPLDYSAAPEVRYAMNPRTQGLLSEAKAAGDEFDRLGAINRDTQPIGPYVDTTSKWVDMVLRRNLLDAINSGADYMTIGNPRMVKEMTYGQDAGQTAFYGDIVPRRFKEIASKIDKGAEFGPVGIQTEGLGTQSVMGLKLTPEFVEQARRKGIPYWMLAGGIFGGGLLGGGDQAQAQPQQPDTGIFGFLGGR